MSEIPIYIEMDEEIEDMLASSGWSIRKILHKHKIQSSVRFGPLPYQNESGVQTKDAATIIMASSAAIYLISKAITNVLNEIYHKPIYDTYHEQVSVTDDNGKIIINPETKEPFMRLKKQHVVIKPRQPDKQAELSAGLKGLVMKFTSKK